MSGKGFRGGTTFRGRAQDGEGWQGAGAHTGTSAYSGGRGSSSNGTGYGGAYLTTNGGSTVYGLTDLLTNINLGGGGGAGRFGAGNQTNPGGISGGVVLAYIADHNGYSGSVLSNGGGSSGGNNVNSGGGSGGGVLLLSSSSYAGTVTAAGGGSGGSTPRPGGLGIVAQTTPSVAPTADAV